MLTYLAEHWEDLLEALGEHLVLTMLALALSLILAALLTVASLYVKGLGAFLVRFFSVLYGVPSLALFALLIPLTGLGGTTAVLVLTIYNQYLLLRNFLTGLSQANPGAVEAAWGLGMTRMQILRKVQLPLASRALFAGIQLAVICTVGIATIAAMINAGGLGTILFDGLRTLNTVKILWGCILCGGLTLLLNAGFHLLERKLERPYLA